MGGRCPNSNYFCVNFFAIITFRVDVAEKLSGFVVKITRRDRQAIAEL